MNCTYPRISRIRGFTSIPLLLVFVLPASSYAARSSVRYAKRWVAGVPAHVVTVNLNDPDVHVTPVIPRYGIGRSEPWGRMIGRARPTAAITGTFFSTRSNYPTGDIVVEGDLKCRGRVGTAIGIGWDNSIVLRPTKRGRVRDWSGFRHVIVGGPVLVWNGRISVNPREQGFRDSRLFARRARTAVGATRSGKLLMVAVTRPVYLSKLARVMKGLGAVRAAALDGGGSTALYYRGRTLARPNRRLTNLLVAYDSSSLHARVKDVLAPAGNRLAGRPEARTR